MVGVQRRPQPTRASFSLHNAWKFFTLGFFTLLVLFLAQSAHAILIRSGDTINNAYSSWALSGTFSMSFVATQAGMPRRLAVHIGNNQNQFSCTVVLTVRGISYTNTYSGLVQNSGDSWTVGFDLSAATTFVNAGDTVTFSLTPSTSVGFAAITGTISGYNKGTVPNYGAALARFYFDVDNLVSITPSPSVSITPSITPSATVAPQGLAIPTRAGDTMSYGGSTWAYSGTFVQTFIATSSGFPTQLNVYMGNNQNPFSVSLEIRKAGVTIFTGRFDNLKQSYSDWTVTLGLGIVGVYVNAGDTITFILSNPSTSVGFQAITGAIAGYTAGTVQNYGNCISRFYFVVTNYVSQSPSASATASLSPSSSTSLSPSVTPSSTSSPSLTASPSIAAAGLQITNRLGDTYAYGYSSWAFSGSFTQSFTAASTGYPRWLNVHIGNNQNPFDVTVDLFHKGVRIFTRRYTSLVQSYSDWSVTFDLGILGNFVQVGDSLSFVLSSPSTSIGFAAITSQISGYTQGTVSGYGATNSRFYLRSVDYVSQSPSASISISSSASASATISPSLSSTPSASISISSSPSVNPQGLAQWRRAGDTYSYGYSSWAWSSSFTESFVAIASGFPRILNVHIGNNQNPFDVSLDLYHKGVRIFTRRYTSLVQSYSDWSVALDLGILGNYIQVGDSLSFTIYSASTSIGFAAITSQISGYTQGTVPGYGSANARFYLQVVDYVSQSPSASVTASTTPSLTPSVTTSPSLTATPSITASSSSTPTSSASVSPSASISISSSPSITASASPSQNPVGVPQLNRAGDTYSNGYSMWAWSSSFNQTWTAIANGYPKTLNVHIGNNQNPFDVSVILYVNGVLIFSRRYTSLVQSYSDWSVAFDLGLLGNYIQVGDTLTFVLQSASTAVGFAAITGGVPGYIAGTVPGYGSATARFYLQVIDYVSASPTPSVTASVTPSTSASPSISFSPTTSPSLTPTCSPSESSSASPSATTSITPSTTPSLSSSASPSVTASITASTSPSVSASVSASPSSSISLSASPSTSLSSSPSTSISPSSSISISPSASSSITASPSASTSLSATPSITSSPSPSNPPDGLQVPGRAGDTYSLSSGYSMWAWGSDPFTQTFVARDGGYPQNLNIHIGNNQIQFDVTLELIINAQKIFTRRYHNLVQSYSDWSVRFDLAPLGNYISPGDIVAFTIKDPSMALGFAALTADYPGYQKGSVRGYGAANARFYLNVIDYVSQSPTPSITPSATVSPSESASPSVTPSPSISESASPSPTASVSASASVTPSPSISESPSTTPSLSPSVTPTVSPSESASPSVSPSPSESATPSVTPSPSISESPSTTPSLSASATATVSPSESASPSVTASPSETPSSSASPSPSISESPSSSVTPSPSISISSSATPSISVSPSITPSISITPSASPSNNPVGVPLLQRAADTYPNGYSTWLFSGSFTQKFTVTGSGYPRYLNVHLGNNQNPFDVSLELTLNDVLIFSRRYNSLVQSYSDWSITFDLGILGNYIQPGDIMTYRLFNPSTGVGFAAVTASLAGVEKGYIQSYGSTNSRFYLQVIDYVSASPTPSSSASPSITPSASPTSSPSPSISASPSIAPTGVALWSRAGDTYSNGYSMWALIPSYGGMFVQTFTATSSGYPRKLSIHMGNNQNPFAVTLDLYLNNTRILNRRYSNLVQQYSDWSVPLDLGILGNYISQGDTVAFALYAPSTTIGIAAIKSTLSGYTQGSVPGYGLANSKFYFEVVDYVQPSSNASPAA